MDQIPAEDDQTPRGLDIDPCKLCWEMAGELKDIATWLAEEELTADEFALTVSHFEKRKLARLGFKLSSAISEGPVVHFSLRFAQSGELCASMDVNPRTGGIQVQPACA